VIYRIRYTKNREWAAFIRPRQEVSITKVEEFAPYHHKVEQSWLLDIDEGNIVRAIHEAYPLFKQYFWTEGININEIYMTEYDKEARLAMFSRHLFNKKKAKLNGLNCHLNNDEETVVIYSPETEGPIKQTHVTRVLEIAEEYIFTQSTESPGDLWLKI
jgi:hypothetical protein